jgi:UDP-GlcNAc3NAcA epimerase
LIIENHDFQIVLPLYPRTRNRLKNIYDSLITKFFNNHKVTIDDPVSFFKLRFLEKYSNFSFTDSGGVQKESYFYNNQCIILRKETEWLEIGQTEMA